MLIRSIALGAVACTLLSASVVWFAVGAGASSKAPPKTRVEAPSITCRDVGTVADKEHEAYIVSTEGRKWGAMLLDAEIKACFGPQYRPILGLLHEIEKQKEGFEARGYHAYTWSHWLGLLTVIFGVVSSAAVTLSSTVKTEELPTGSSVGTWLASLGLWLKIAAVASTICLSLLAGLQNFYKPAEMMIWAFTAKEDLDRLHTEIDRYLLAAAVVGPKEATYLNSVFTDQKSTLTIDAKRLATWQERFDQILATANKAINERHKKDG